MSNGDVEKSQFRKRPPVELIRRARNPLARILDFVQKYDKVFQILAISVPGLIFTYLYNQFQETQKQLETINTLQTSILSNDLSRRRVGFWLLLSLPNKSLIQTVFYALPEDTQDKIIIENLVPAIQALKASSVRKITSNLCEGVKRVESEAQTLPFEGNSEDGHLIQLTKFYKDHASAANIVSDLIACGSQIEAERLLPPPGKRHVTIYKEVLPEAIEAKNMEAVRAMIAALHKRDGNNEALISAIEANDKILRFGIINRNFVALGTILDTVANDDRPCRASFASNIAEWPDSYFKPSAPNDVEVSSFFERYQKNPWKRCLEELDPETQQKVRYRISIASSRSR